MVRQFGMAAGLSRKLLFLIVLVGSVLCLYNQAFADFFPLGDTSEVSAFSEERIQLRSPSDTGTRPPLLYEGGDLFLGVGDLYEGFETPWGAVWQPQLWVFGTVRSSLFTFENGVESPSAEWANRFDLYANVQLTGTEKLIVGIRPFDRNRLDRFTRATINDNRGDGRTEFSADVRTLFFEGDFGSLFPKLDPGGTTWLDYGFSVGRQLLQFQEGILLNDEIDALGLVRNNIRLPGVSNLRTSFVWGWNEVGRSNAVRDDSTQLFGLFNSLDTYISSYNIDLVYVVDGVGDTDGFNFGLSAIQRIGHFNTAFRINSSVSDGEDSPAAGEGTLFSAEVSWTVEKSDDIVYINPFIAAGNYTQAGREPVVGGPLGALGILFASPSLGNFGSELNSFSDDVAGVAMGYQAFWNHHRTSLTLELAGRKDTSGERFDDVAFGFEFRQRLAHRIQLQIDSHYTVQEKRDDGYGLRTEILYQF